ncbi:hypothetical protein M5689_011160 [Euphorbia peplus]|nr:hypothetical protein M5689_011160 [Euphorbia peplus]
MAITGHFIDDAWNLQSRIIRFIYVPSPHTTDVICDALIDCMMDWNLDTKLSTLTLDNCSTNDSMVSMILSKLPRDKLMLHGTYLHMRCCAHILNLVVKDGLEVIGEAIEKIHDSVSFWSATPKRVEKFEATLRQLKIPFSKKLVLDCKTRWNSTFLMLQVAISYKDAFKQLKQRDSLYKCVPSDQEWEVAREFCKRLELFYRVTERFSGTHFPTANLYFPNICQIRVALDE